MMQIRRGLYVITDPDLSQDLCYDVEAALLGGATIVQYRNKRADRDDALTELELLRPLCHSAEALLLVNDDVELARESGADGVHLGRDDIPYEEARELLGDEAIIGISCYNNLECALEMEARGASYVAFGRFFHSQSKPQAVQAAIELLRTAKQHLQVPVVAIGGITAQNGATLIEAGADLLAVIHGVFGQADVRRASESFSTLFLES
ncbi:thiamine phosphate synthase [Solemya elarraichensis gill symbiont]|uniref:Thiamine-phosphate synthase n=1 Tax=Solemya elarraichensis gill symbiont TaxID=1918949 RepID=A0A1T2L4Z8_9GAMM|nr:thiamine phosphate synthase [Solemya elarraichensis gill symbiont]OOZ40188.1 thiamine-phosphate diphosphorylase [Solemya elarraichensis gill symbiont]